MAQLARLSSSCLGTGALSDTAQPLPHVYAIRVGFPWNKSYDSILQCWSRRDSLCTKRMGTTLPLCSTRAFSTAGWARRLFNVTGYITRLRPQFLHWSFEFSISFIEQEGNPREKPALRRGRSGHRGRRGACHQPGFLLSVAWKDVVLLPSAGGDNCIYKYK